MPWCGIVLGAPRKASRVVKACAPFTVGDQRSLASNLIQNKFCIGISPACVHHPRSQLPDSSTFAFPPTVCCLVVCLQSHWKCKSRRLMHHQNSGSIEKLPFCVENIFYVMMMGVEVGGQGEASSQVGVVKIRHFTIVSAISFVMKWKFNT